MSHPVSAPEYPATMLVHWPTGPIACCDDHGRQLIGLGNFLGSHIVATALTAPAECVNCLNEGPPVNDQGRPHSQQERAGSPDRKDDTQ